MKAQFLKNILDLKCTTNTRSIQLSTLLWQYNAYIEKKKEWQ